MRATTVSPRFKALVQIAAAQENRRLTNILGMQVFANCDKFGLKEPVAKPNKAKGAVK